MKSVYRFPSNSKKAFEFAVLLTVLGVICSCEKPKSSFDLNEIRPRVDSTDSGAPPQSGGSETGLVRETFDLPVESALALLKSAKIADTQLQKENDLDPFGAADPFDAETPESDTKRKSLQPLHQAFENLGIPFADGSSATYDSENGKLTVVQSTESMGLIRQVLAGFRKIPRTAALRFEFYEVPAHLALRLEQSAAPHLDATPEWEALQELLDEDEVRLVDLATLQSQSGQRSKFEDGKSFTFQSGWQSRPTDEDPDPDPIIEERLVGTTIETDIVIGDDGHTIDMTFMMEYHNAPPEFVPTKRDTDETYSVPAAVFHMKEIVTTVTLHDGETRLLTSWTPTGKPEYKKGDRRILVFVTANLQRDH